MGKSQAVKKEVDEAVTDELEPGHELMQGQYTIDAFLNAGGFGITYLARNSLDRKVVIKECFPGSFCRRTAKSVQARSRSHTKELASIVSKFVDEAHSLAKVDHPNIVGVHQVFEENKTAYMALDFVEGRDLLEIIEDQKDQPEPEQIETILKKLLDAVGHIHEQGILHRDISPDNILLQSNMEPILIDFGAARQDAGQENRILSELRVVKDGYSPQEFYVSGAEQGPYSDLYALAATFYHVVTGELPVNSQTRLATVAGGDDDPYVSIAGRATGYSDAFLAGIDKALQILPKDRYASASIWLDLLQGSGGAETSVGSVKPNESRALVRRVEPEAQNKTKVRVLAGLGLAVPILGGAFFLQMGGADPAAQDAATALASAEPAVTAPASEPSLAAAPAPSQDAATATDLSAVLNLSSPAAQPEAPSSDLTNALGLNLGGDTNVASDAAPAEATPAPSGDLASALGLTAGEDAFAAQAEAAPAPSTDITSALGLATGDDTPAASDTPDAEVELALGLTDAPQAVAQPAAPLNIESFDLPKVFSAWSVDLTGALPDANATVYAVDGVPLGPDAEIDTVLYQNMDAPEGGTMELAVLAGELEDTATLETVVVPVVQRTSFEDGTVFEARLIDGTWTTKVTTAPAGSALQADDVLVGDLGTQVPFDSRTSLPEVLVQANAANAERLSIAVRREGTMTATSIEVPR